MHRTYDVIVIGAGFAGLSAALWLGRYRRRTLVLSSGPSRNTNAKAVHGYPGFEGANPNEVLAKVKAEALAYPSIRIAEALVTAAHHSKTNFTVHTDDDNTYVAKRLLIATGHEEITIDIPGMQELAGRSVWHCPACDGYEYTNKRIAVLGWSPDIAAYAQLFLAYSPHVTVYTHGNDLAASTAAQLESRHIAITSQKISSVKKTATGQRIITGNDSQEFEAIFQHLSGRPRVGLARQLGCEVVENAYVAVGSKQQTTVPGVYAAGDITPYEELIVVACSTGAIAASNIHKSL